MEGFGLSPEVKLLMLPTIVVIHKPQRFFFGWSMFNFVATEDGITQRFQEDILYIMYIYINKYIHILDDSCWFIDPDASRCPWLYNVLPGGAVKVSHHWSRGIGTCHASERCLEYLGDGGWVRGWGHGLTPRVKHKRGFKTLNCSKPVGNRFFSQTFAGFYRCIMQF